MTGSLFIKTDGASKGNPGPSACGAVVFDGQTHDILGGAAKY
ncbi:MAG: hypothetical protein QM571_02375 [Micrococcaceae bacterium]